MTSPESRDTNPLSVSGGLVPYPPSDSDSDSNSNSNDNDNDNDNDDDDDDKSVTNPPPSSSTAARGGVTTGKRRRLPPLSDDLSPLPAPDDDSNDDEEGGGSSSKRKKGVVKGEWLCHVFLPVNPAASSALAEVVGRCQSAARVRFGERFHPLLVPSSRSSEQGEGQEQLLHVSLTRPILLRAHEREMFVHEVAASVHAAAKREELRRFPLSFARLDKLRNDDATRDFLVLELGTGWREVKALSDSLSISLRRLVRARAYYEEARFHASVGWVDVLPHPHSVVQGSSVSDGVNDPERSAPAASSSSSNEAGPLPSLPRPVSDAAKQGEEGKVGIDAAFLVELRERMAGKLARCPPLLVERVGVRVGKRVSWVDLWPS